MSDLPNGLLTLNNNVLVALDLETTGLVAGYHDVIQAAVLPLDVNLDPMEGVSPFYMNIQPMFPARATPRAMEVNGLDMDHLMTCPSSAQAADCFEEWFYDLKLPVGKRLITLCQNSPFDIPHMKAWLGEAGFGRCFGRRGRDTMYLAQGYNDKAAWRNQPIPFPSVGLKALCEKFGIELDNHHDALADCVATAKVYRELLRWES